MQITLDLYFLVREDSSVSVCHTAGVQVHIASPNFCLTFDLDRLRHMFDINGSRVPESQSPKVHKCFQNFSQMDFSPKVSSQDLFFLFLNICLPVCLCVSILSIHLSIHFIYCLSVPIEARRGYWIGSSWKWSYRQL